MNITEKILAKHSNKDKVTPGEIVMADVDLVMGNELSTIVAIEELEKHDIKSIFDPNKVAIVLDHFVPAKDIQTAQICKKIREFVRKHNIKHFFDTGKGGIEHVVIPDEGLALPSQVIVGGDSHTTTYGALGCFSCGVGSTDMAFALSTGKIWLKVPETIRIIYTGKLKEWVSAKDVILFTIGELGVEGARYKNVEFSGEVINKMEMEGRFTLCNMAAEIGAKSAIIAPDNITLDFLSTTTGIKEFELTTHDEDARYSATYILDVSGLEPMIACPHSPEKVIPISRLEEVKLDQVFIGSCTNGRIGDLRIAAQILKGKKIAPDLRCIIIPGSQRVFLQALKEGLIEIFISAGCAVSTPTCGACVGGHMGILASREVCLSTTNRNFVGRMGHKEARIYLSNPAVAAASAVAGKIIHPSEIV